MHTGEGHIDSLIGRGSFLVIKHNPRINAIMIKSFFIDFPPFIFEVLHAYIIHEKKL